MIAASLRRLLPPERLAPCIMRRPQVLTRSINHAESAAAVQRLLTSIDAILLQSGFSALGAKLARAGYHYPILVTQPVGDVPGLGPLRLPLQGLGAGVASCCQCQYHDDRRTFGGLGLGNRCHWRGPRRRLEVGSAASKLNAARRSLGARPPRPDRRKLRSPGQGQYPGSSKLAHTQAGTAVGPRPGVAASLSSGTTE